jgi:hypothetical protein
MPWVGNQYIFPRAAPAYATWPVTPPAAPAPPPAIPQLWMRPEQTDGGDGGFEDPPDSSFGGTPPGPTAPGTDPDPDPGPPLGVSGYAPYASYAGTALSGLLSGVPGLGIVGGLLGSISDVSRAEAALAEEYGTNPPGYPRGYSPEISILDTFLSAISPFGIFGESVEDALARAVAHMGVVGLEGAGYQTSPYDTMGFIGGEGPAGGWGSPGGLAIGGEVSSGGWGSPGGLAIGGESPSGGEFGGGGESDVGGEGMDDGMGME